MRHRSSFQYSLLSRILLAKFYMQRASEAGHLQTTHFESLQACAQACASFFAGVLVGQDLQDRGA